ncbi:MAG: hypothetical protein ACFE0O_02215 [Opitutales bacterium]
MNELWEFTTWLNLRLDHPADWELLAYGKDPERGRLSFADRSGVRLELSWQQLAGNPDLRRMVGDYRVRLEEQYPTARRSVADRPGWRGFHIRPEEGPVQSRFLRHERGLDRALELVVIGKGADPDEPLLERILSSVGEESAAADGSRRWRCWGLETWVPAGMNLQSVTAQPAHLALTFADPSGRETVEVSRRGLLDLWLEQPLDAWFRDQMPAGFRADPEGMTTETPQPGHSARRIAGSFRERAAMLGGRSLRLIASAWICPTHRRLVAWQRRSRQRQPRVPRVICCPAPVLP